MTFNAVRTLTGCLLDVEADADLQGWGQPPLLLLAQDRPAPSAASGTRRQMRVAHLPLDDRRLGRYRAGLVDFLPDLAHTLHADRPVGRPTLATCVDTCLIADLLADPTPGIRLLAWGIRYEDVRIAADEMHEIRRIDAVDVDRRSYQITRRRNTPRPAVRVDDHVGHDNAPTIRAGLTRLVYTTGRSTPKRTT
ncbi:hypothetical protein ACQP2H_30255 [Micromonospora sp. CA-248260]|uniref:hypothetical protein n=1 Tax=Micromonospora sp. CA-248260 TaxID=3239962 RepID=UPI003D8E0D78